MKTKRLSVFFAGVCLMASASAMADPGERAVPHYNAPRGEQMHRDIRHDSRHVAPAHARRHVTHVAPAAHRRPDDHMKHHRWQRGDRIPPGYRSSRYVVKDWHRHGLKRPGKGYEWVSVGRDYLLIAAATGLIAHAVLSR